MSKLIQGYFLVTCIVLLAVAVCIACQGKTLGPAALVCAVAYLLKILKAE